MSDEVERTAQVEMFTFGEQRVRCSGGGDAPWFVLRDLAMALGYRDASNAARYTRPDQRSTQLLSTADGPRRVTTVSESGMYRLIMRSNRPEAERFQDWVTDEVLPALRRHGTYSMPGAVQAPRLVPGPPPHPMVAWVVASFVAGMVLGVSAMSRLVRRAEDERDAANFPGRSFLTFGAESPAAPSGTHGYPPPGAGPVAGRSAPRAATFGDRAPLPAAEEDR